LAPILKILRPIIFNIVTPNDLEKKNGDFDSNYVCSSAIQAEKHPDISFQENCQFYAENWYKSPKMVIITLALGTHVPLCMNSKSSSMRAEWFGLIYGPLTMDPELRKENYSWLVIVLW
jgi:hypothetical protein